MIYPNDITSLKTDISQKIGQKIIVKGSLGRNKPFEKEAVIDNDSYLLLSGGYCGEDEFISKEAVMFLDILQSI